MKSNTKKRLIAFMLCMVLVLSSAISAFADEGTVHRVPTDTVELSSEIMKDGVSQGTLFATIPLSLIPVNGRKCNSSNESTIGNRRVDCNRKYSE